MEIATETPAAPSKPKAPPVPILGVQYQEQAGNNRWVTKKEIKGKSHFWPTILIVDKKLGKLDLASNQRLRLVRFADPEDQKAEWVADLKGDLSLDTVNLDLLPNQIYYDPNLTNWRILIDGCLYSLNLEAKVLAKKGRYITTKPGNTEGIYLEISAIRSDTIAATVLKAQNRSGIWMINNHSEGQKITAQVGLKTRF